MMMMMMMISRLSWATYQDPISKTKIICGASGNISGPGAVCSLSSSSLASWPSAPSSPHPWPLVVLRCCPALCISMKLLSCGSQLLTMSEETRAILKTTQNVRQKGEWPLVIEVQVVALVSFGPAPGAPHSGVILNAWWLLHFLSYCPFQGTVRPLFASHWFGLMTLDILHDKVLIILYCSCKMSAVFSPRPPPNFPPFWKVYLYISQLYSL